MDSADHQLSKPRPSVRSRRGAKPWPGGCVELRDEQFIWLRRHQRVRRHWDACQCMGRFTSEPPGAIEVNRILPNKSGRFSRVRLIACSLRHFAISA